MDILFIFNWTLVEAKSRISKHPSDLKGATIIKTSYVFKQWECLSEWRCSRMQESAHNWSKPIHTWLKHQWFYSLQHMPASWIIEMQTITRMRIQSLQDMWIDIVKRISAVHAVQVPIVWNLGPRILLTRVRLLHKVVSSVGAVW